MESISLAQYPVHLEEVHVSGQHEESIVLTDRSGSQTGKSTQVREAQWTPEVLSSDVRKNSQELLVIRGLSKDGS